MDSPLHPFLADAKDIIDRLYADLQQLRSLRAQGRYRRELASRIFRHVHTLKGSAGSVGLKNVSQLAHEFEGVLDAVRLGRVAIDDPVINLFDDTVDAIAESIENSGRGDESASQALIARLHAVSSERVDTRQSLGQRRVVRLAQQATAHLLPQAHQRLFHQVFVHVRPYQGLGRHKPPS